MSSTKTKQCPNYPQYANVCYDCEYFKRCCEDAIYDHQMHIQYLKELEHGAKRFNADSSKV